MNTRELTKHALFIAIVFISTYVIQFTLPLPGTGGLVHCGNIAAFTIAVVFGKKYGAVSGAFGMTLFDILSGWVLWAPGTFVIRWICGYVIGAIAHSDNNRGINIKTNIVAMLAGSGIIVIGYYFYQVLLYGNWIVAAGSIVGDIIQSLFGMAGAMLLIPAVTKIQKGAHI